MDNQLFSIAQDGHVIDSASFLRSKESFLTFQQFLYGVDDFKGLFGLLCYFVVFPIQTSVQA